MRTGTLSLGLLLAVSVSCAPPVTVDPVPQPTGTALPQPAPSAALEWVAAAGLPAGAQMAVVSGNPSEAGDFTVQLRFPNDYRVPPHTHPAAETVTVVSGILHVGMGGTFSMSGNITELRPGQSIVLPPNEPHFGHAAGETVIEVRSMGPFQLNYVNPADAPTP